MFELGLSGQTFEAICSVRSGVNGYCMNRKLSLAQGESSMLIGAEAFVFLFETGLLVF